VVHIVPWYLQKKGLNEDQKNLFWSRCRTFWGKRRIDAWNKTISMGEKPTVCENLLTLSPPASFYLMAGYLTLKPLESHNPTKLQAEVHWLPRCNKSSEPRDVCTVPEARVGSEDDILKEYYMLAMRPGPNQAQVRDEFGEPIKSGTIITMETDDPVQKPLPDVGLLDMHWCLSRLFALRGDYQPEKPQYLTSRADYDFEYPMFLSISRNGFDLDSDDDDLFRW